MGRVAMQMEYLKEMIIYSTIVVVNECARGESKESSLRFKKLKEKGKLCGPL
jgi:hypothetical protein